MANYCVLFFPESQASEVLSESSIIHGSVTVGRHVPVQWKDNKLYDANILYIGPEANCDAKIQYVTTTGQLKNRFFSASGPPPAKKHRSSSCTRNIPHNMAPAEPPITDPAVSQIDQLNKDF
uniref:MBD domain-containing protein n=1 Tax=Heterorhabditis bacteriophora TaxID=37862 RepID=A0A1I7W7Q9_HETBA